MSAPPTASPVEYRRWLLENPEHVAPWLDELLSPGEVVAEFGKIAPTVAALAMMRSRGTGPRFVKLGQKVLYRRFDILRHLEASVVGTRHDPLERAS